MGNIINIIQDIFLDEMGNLNLIGKLARIILIIIGIRIMVSIFNTIIDRTMKEKKNSHTSVDIKRLNTIKEIVKKIGRYILYFIGMVIILEMFNIDTKSIIATAGIGGIAIGFGAQSLVRDIITGFFILLEDQYSAGDYIKIDSYEGIVEELGLRVTKLRSFSGELHIIPNGKVETVTNKSRGAMRARINVIIPYEESLERAMAILNNIAKEIKDKNDNILEGPTVVGIGDLEENGVSIIIVARTKPMEQWAVERELRKKVKEAFEREDIKVAYPKRVIFGGKDDDFEI